jgi:hypothetical protein
VKLCQLLVVSLQTDYRFGLGLQDGLNLRQHLIEIGVIFQPGG